MDGHPAADLGGRGLASKTNLSQGTRYINSALIGSDSTYGSRLLPSNT